MSAIARPLTPPPSRLVVTVGALAAIGVLVWGGYGRHWSWTGFTANDTLWDWLQMLVLPVSLAALPLWLSSHRQMSRTRTWCYCAALTGFGGLVILGYAVPLKWTGFTGNTLWDWLQLLLLPAVVATIKFWTTERTIEARHRIGALALAASFGAFITCAYLLPIGWTGFTGNTLWDWIKLLIVPIVLPLLIVPAVTDWITAGVVEEEAIEQAEQDAGAQVGATCPTCGS
jgi:hypothetical protein